MVGSPPSTHSGVRMTFLMVRSEGILNMMPVMIFSRIARSPLAPICLSMAFFATAFMASSVISSCTPSISSSF